MEFKNGDVSLLSIPQSWNSFNTSRYKVSDFPDNTLSAILCFPKTSNFLNLALTMIVWAFPSLSPYNFIVFGIPIIVGLPIQLIAEYVLDRERTRSNRVINAMKVQRGKRKTGGLEEEVGFDELQIGDIIYLKKGDIVPAGIVVLDTGMVKDREAMCMVDTHYTNGKSTLVKKKSCYLTQQIITRTRQKNNLKEYRKLLTGRLEYKWPSGHIEKFKGWLKLKKDPKSEQLTFENFIARGCKIRQTSWLFGLVVYVGEQTKIMQSANYSKYKHSQYTAISNTLTSAHFALAVFFSLLFSILLLSRQGELHFLHYDPTFKNGHKILTYLLAFAIFIPNLLFILYDVTLFIMKFLFEQKVPHIRINDPNVIPNLGNIDYMLIDKTGTLTTSAQKIQCILYGQNCYTVEHDHLFQSLRDKADNKHYYDEENYLIADEISMSKQLNVSRQPKKNLDLFRSNIRFYRSNQRKITTKLNTHQCDNYDLKFNLNQASTNHFIEDLKLLQKSKMDNDQVLLFDTFMKCIMICHEARPVYYTSETCYESFSKHEEAALELAQISGYGWMSVTNSENCQEYHCNIQGKQVTYKILGVNQYTYTRNVNSVIIQAPASNPQLRSTFAPISHLCGKGSGKQSLLICKGDYDSLKANIALSQKQQEELENTIDFYQKKGIRVIIYAAKEVNQKQTENYFFQYTNLKSQLTLQNKQLQKLALKYETELQLVGILGFKEELKPESIELISHIQACNINFWVLSGDQEASTLSCTKQLTDLSQARLIRIKHRHKAEIFSEIDDILQLIQYEKKQLEKKRKSKMIRSSTTLFQSDMLNQINKFVLSINGKSLKIIKTNKELLSHFKFLTSLCKSVIGYNLRPQQKQFLCSLIKENQLLPPTILAIGDGYNDSLMMQEADISMEILNKGRCTKQFTTQVNAGDIIITELSQVKKLFCLGKMQMERVHYLTLEVYQQSLFLGLQVFFYNWFNSLSGSSLFSSEALVFMIFIFPLPCFLHQVLIHDYSDLNANQKLPALYVDGQIMKNYWAQEYLIKVLVALVESTATMYFSIYTFNDLFLIETALIFNFTLFFSLKNLTNTFSKNPLSSFAIFSLTMMFLVMFFIVSTPINYFLYLRNLFSHFTYIFAMAFNLVVMHLASYFGQVLKLVIYPRVYDQFANNDESQSSYTVTNQEVLSQTIGKTLDFSKIVKRTFKNIDYISPYIQEMLHAGDTQVTEMKLKWLTLEIRELILEKKFQSAKLSSSISHFRFFFTIISASLTIFLLLDISSHSFVFQFYHYVSLMGFLVIVAVVIFIPRFSSLYFDYSHLMVGFFVLIKIISDWSTPDELSLTLVNQILILITTMHTLNLRIVPVILYISMFTVQYILLALFNLKFTSYQREDQLYSESRKSVFVLTSLVLLNVKIMFMLLHLNYNIIKQRRSDFLARYAIEQEHFITQDILSILVPKFVQPYLTRGDYQQLQEIELDISILFCYICDFDSIIEEEGKNIVIILDSLFRIYDNLCIEHGVQKIETVGYTYMAAAGISKCDKLLTDHIRRISKTERLVKLAFDMQKQVGGLKYGQGNQMEIKIGIHCGDVVTAVIGYHKPQFSLIGDPVNQTSRYASTGEPGQISLSESAFKQARKSIKFYQKCQKYAKGVGQILVYQVFEEQPKNYLQSFSQQAFQRAFKKITSDEKFKELVKSKSQNKSILQILRSNQQLILKEEEREKKTPAFKKMISIVNESTGQIDYEEMQQEQDDEVELDVQQIEERLLNPNKCILRIPAKQFKYYRNFQMIEQDKNWKNSRFLLVALWLTYLIITLLLIIVNKLFKERYLIFYLRGVYSLLLIPLLFLIKKAFTSAKIQYFFFLFLQLGCYSTLIQNYLTSSEQVSRISTLELFYFLVITSHLQIFSFFQLQIFMTLILGGAIGVVMVSENNIMMNIFYLFLSVILILISEYFHIKENIAIFNNLQINEKKKEKQLKVVSQLLPMHSFNKLKNSSIYNHSDLFDEFSDVTLLFADIKGFTCYSKNCQSNLQVATMLRNLFTEFDRKCREYQVYKLYTIGDCYVVMGFINSSQRNPVQEAINTVNMGFEMITIIKKVREDLQFPELGMRIGIHTGNIIGGIIGTDIVRYDVYGKDVTIANKMESSGQEGCIQVSEETKKIIQKSDSHGFAFKDQKVNQFNIELLQNIVFAQFNSRLSGYIIEKKEKEAFLY